MGGVVGSGVGRRSRAAVGRRLLLLVALGGLFAMHGLSDHGVGAPTALDSAVAHLDAHTGGGGHQVGAGASSAGGVQGAAVAASLPVDPTPGSGGGHSDHHGGVPIVMCLAVLAAALFGAAAWRARVLVRLRRVLADDRVAAAGAAFWTRARGPAPPDLRLLSVQRC